MEEKTTPYNRKAPGGEEADVENPESSTEMASPSISSYSKTSQSATNSITEGIGSLSLPAATSQTSLKSHMTCESGLPSPTQQCSGEESSCHMRPQLDHAAFCTTCLDEWKDEKIPKRHVSAGCEHTLESCLECLYNYLRSEIAGTPLDQIECPSCKERFDFFAIKEFADPVTFEKYTLPKPRISRVQPPLIPTLDTIPCYLTNL